MIINYKILESKILLFKYREVIRIKDIKVQVKNDSNIIILFIKYKFTAFNFI